MTECRAVELAETDFTPFGRHIRLDPHGPDVVTATGDGWSGVFSGITLADQPGNLGFTVGRPAPCTAASMERHHHTKEALFTHAEPVLLAVAPPGGDAPRAGDIQTVIIRPGDLVILKEGTWHDACHGLGAASPYYWFAHCDPAIIDPWVPIHGGPVRLIY